MSSRCQCPFSGPSDTILGCHRDPITSEKGWLDFAVRELSRVAAGKARGQEAVWRSQCKPSWWDRVCPHPWKNPTANPKDCKDTLKVKFECLVEHLRKEGQLPREMAEEIGLWEADRKSEVFLMTTFSSLLGQASNLHTLVEEACHKMEDSGISVDVSILTDLERCLTSCVDKLGSIKNMAKERNQKASTSEPARRAGNKRPSGDNSRDVLSQPLCKRPKHSLSPPHSSSFVSPTPSLVQSPPSALSSPPPSTISSSTPPPISSSLSPPVSSSLLLSDSPVRADPSRMLLAALQKQLLEKQVAKLASTSPPDCQARKTSPPVKSKAYPPSPNRSRGGKKIRMQGVGRVGTAAAADTTVQVSLSTFSPATALPDFPVSDMLTENTEFRDFLELDLDNEEVADCQFLNDCQFLDSLLRETSPDVGMSDITTDVSSCSVPSPVPTGTHLSLASDMGRPSNHDPIIGHSLASESSPFQFSVTCEAVTGGEGESDGPEWGAALSSGVGDTVSVLPEIEVVSDSGYNSESSVATSHRGSLDSEHNSHADLNSPDLEAYLDSLEF